MIILAPMQGLTELLFRKAYERVFPKAIDMAISPFLSLTHGNLSDAFKKIDDVLPEANIGSIPVIPQILGKEPEEFVALANRLFEIGYEEVNWNIGCPMRRVAGKHRGSGILPYPNDVQEILEHIIPQLKPQLSIKMRLGYYDKKEIFSLIPILNSFPLKNITIHPRIGKQAYTGTPDMETFSEVVPLLNHKVIYNGDICTAERYHFIKKQYPDIEDIMIGRGILYNPLLPLQIKDTDYSKGQVVEFIEGLVADIIDMPMPSNSKVRKIKEYWCLLYKSIGITEQQRYQVLHCLTLEETLSALRRSIHKQDLA